MFDYIEMDLYERKELFNEWYKDRNRLLFMDATGYYDFKKSLKKDEGMYLILVDGLISEVVPLDEIDETLKELTEFGYELED